MAKQSHTPSRRAMLAGLAVAPVAGLPTIAGVVAEPDPVFAAIAELEGVRVRAKAIGKAHSTIEDAYIAAAPPSAHIVLNGGKYFDHEQIDAHFDDGGMPDENIRAGIKTLLSFRRRPLTAEQQATRETARRAAHADLDRILMAQADAKLRTGFDEAEANWNAAVDAEGDAECALFETEPRTPAGALALLRLAAAHVDEYGVRDNWAGDLIGDAIRNAAAVLEREAQS